MHCDGQGLLRQFLNMKKTVLTSLIIVAAIFASVFALGRGDDSELSSTTASSCQPASQAAADLSRIIKVEANGFSPKSLNIVAGDTVTFINNDTQEHWPASDDHPAHQIYPEFDSKRALCPGEHWSFRFDKAGAWGMHDHLFSSFRGTIIVQ